MVEKATLEVTACYFPKKGEVELTWEDIETGKKAWLTTKVTPEEGNRISNVVMACVYHGAITKEVNHNDS